MSWGTCYKDSGCNSVDFSSPPMVSDGRFFTAYDSNEATEQKIKQTQGNMQHNTVKEALPMPLCFTKRNNKPHRA